MKDKRLLVPVSPKFTTRKFYLCPAPPGRHDWHYRFTPPKAAGAELQRVFRGTGTSNLAAAKRIAAQAVESFWAPKDAGKAAEALKLRNGFALVDEILERYKPRPNDVRAEVAVKNKSALRVVVREITGRQSTDGVRADVLTAAAASKFLDNREARADSQDEVAQERARVSANSTLGQARSVISPGALYLYDDLKLPDFTGFRTAKKLRVDQGYYAYRPLSEATIVQIEQDAQRTKLAAPLRYRAFLLMRYLGLRPSEVWPARKSWIVPLGDGAGVFDIRRRPDFVTKTRRYREVPIAPAVMRELADVLADLHPDAWIINLPTVTERRDLVQDEVNAWLRRFIPRGEYQKCSYNLRKHAGSEIAARDGIEAAADFLGDSISVAEKHYRGRLKRGAGLAVARASLGA